MPTRARYRIRLAGPEDLDVVMDLARALWPDEPARDIRRHMSALLAARPHSTLPLVLFLAERTGAEARAIGFVEVGLRSHAEGCDARRPAGYVEGWYVVPAARKQGVGRALIRAAEDWARAQGCREMGSDTWLDHPAAQRAHRALGFQEVDRHVTYRKPLRGR